MILISFPPTEAEVNEFAHTWTNSLVSEDYEAAFEMLHFVATYPGRSWVSNPNELKACISNRGSQTPIEGEPSYTVTGISTASGELWDNYLNLAPTYERYPGCIGRLDWWLPLNGEWSDLQASFDIVKAEGGAAFVLVALRIP
ncbi:hypothetical protein ACO0LF_02835 [Undibacterium sp. Di27W]|uniref:hypothetical protein n=1 Tax=Undibacterium sp. Di27W TaxID=3413036 RepID=UPI003BF31D7C